MGNPVKVIQPGGQLVECEDTDSGYQKALKGLDGWKLPETVEVEGEGLAPSPGPRRLGRPRKVE